ncbi:MAG TPA: hypothetical protein VIJ87_00685, partial [Pyrinomonadaceae bacterium]
MKIFLSLALLLLFLPQLSAQTPSTSALWQVNSFDISVNVQQAERALNVTATLSATNIGGAAGRTFTVKLNSKAKVSSVSVNGAAATFRPGTEPRGDLFKAEVSLPNAANPGANATLVVNYTLPVESNSGLAAISPVGTAFLPL